MRINTKNLKDINKTIDGIIRDWSTLIEIWNVKPKEEQSGWNNVMKEIMGDIQYDKLIDVPVQLTDMAPVVLETNVAGDKFIGEVVLYIPLTYTRDTGEPIPVIVNEDSLFIIDNDTSSPWRVRSMKRLPGEYVVRIIKMTGGV